MADQTIRLIMGLGNPGPNYSNTRHNAGIWWVSAFLDHTKTPLKTESAFQANLGELEIQGHLVKIGVSNSYMNHSGRVVGSIAKYFDIPPEQIMVVHDDLDIPLGTIRFKTGGGHGGHNGLRDIIHHLKTGDFQRLRIGIGHPGQKDKELVSDYVLSKPTSTEYKEIQEAIQESFRVVPKIITGNFNEAMNLLHASSVKGA